MESEIRGILVSQTADQGPDCARPNQKCCTDFIVSGAGAKTTDLENRGNATFFEDDQKEGFMWIEIQNNCFYGEFYDFEGNLDFSHQICK